MDGLLPKSTLIGTLVKVFRYIILSVSLFCSDQQIENYMIDKNCQINLIQKLNDKRAVLCFF